MRLQNGKLGMQQEIRQEDGTWAAPSPLCMFSSGESGQGRWSLTPAAVLGYGGAQPCDPGHRLSYGSLPQPWAPVFLQADVSWGWVRVDSADTHCW